MIGTIIRAAGEYPTQAKINEIVKEANDKDGTVSFETFVTSIEEMRKNEKKPTSADVEEAFRNFDTEKKGVIHVDELRSVLTTLGEPLSEEEMRKFVEIADISEEGLVDYAQLAKKLIP